MFERYFSLLAYGVGMGCAGLGTTITVLTQPVGQWWILAISLPLLLVLYGLIEIECWRLERELEAKADLVQARLRAERAKEKAQESA